MTITERTELILAEVDRAMQLPSGVCHVCEAPSEREYCSPEHRHELWCARRGLRSEFSLYDMRGE